MYFVSDKIIFQELRENKDIAGKGKTKRICHLQTHPSRVAKTVLQLIKQDSWHMKKEERTMGKAKLWVNRLNRLPFFSRGFKIIING